MLNVRFFRSSVLYCTVSYCFVLYCIVLYRCFVLYRESRLLKRLYCPSNFLVVLHVVLSNCVSLSPSQILLYGSNFFRCNEVYCPPGIKKKTKKNLFKYPLSNNTCKIVFSRFLLTGVFFFLFMHNLETPYFSS